MVEGEALHRFQLHTCCILLRFSQGLARVSESGAHRPGHRLANSIHLLSRPTLSSPGHGKVGQDEAEKAKIANKAKSY